MSGQHTPGPWRTDPFGNYIWASGDPYGHGDMMVAQVRGWGHLTGVGACAMPEDEAIAIQKANARLIAAAPDLYDACRDALAELMEHVDPFQPPGLRQKLADALAKAEGRT